MIQHRAGSSEARKHRGTTIVDAIDNKEAAQGLLTNRRLEGKEYNWKDHQVKRDVTSTFEPTRRRSSEPGGDTSGDPTRTVDTRNESKAGRPTTRLSKLKECSTVTRRSVDDLDEEKQATVCLRIIPLQ